MPPFSPLDHDHMWFYLNDFDYKNQKLVKFFIIRVIKYYTKVYPDIIKNMINYHHDEFSKYLQEHDNHEKVLVAWAKDKHTKCT